MAINWNNVAAPDLGESNNLFAQAIASLKDAGAGLKDTAKDYQTVVRNRSHAILQDYINSAKTPEELQSEAFNTGFKNLQATLANEYDAVKVNDYRDSAVDKLTRRAGDAVALKRNTLGLATDQQAVDTNDMMNRIFTAPESERPALIAEAVKLNRFDAKGMLTNQVGNAQLTQLTDANNLFKVQKPFLEVQPKLANEASEQSTNASKASVLNQAGQLTLAQQRLQFDKDKAAAEALLKANGGDVPYEQRPVNIANKILTEQKNKVRTLEQAAENANLGKSTFSTMDDVDAAFKKKQPWYKTSTTSSAMDEIKKILIADPTFVKLDPKRQAAIYSDTISRMENNNVAGAHDYIVTDGNRIEYAQMAQDSIKAFTGHIGVAKGQVDVLNQDTVLRLNREAQVPLQTAKDMVAYDMGRVDTNPNANAKPAAQTPLQATNAAKIAGLQDKLKVKGLDLLQKAHIEKQLRDLGATPQAASPAITPVAKQVQKTVYAGTPIEKVAQAVATTPTPFVPEASQNAYKNKGNNLSIDPTTGKTTPAKNPVVMPADLDWGTTHQVVRMSPLVAKLPQYKVVATFVPDGDTFAAKSDSYATKGEKAKKAGGILCRVDSVDAPETEKKGYKLGQPYGAEAGKKLQQMILNKEVSIRIVAAANGDPNQVGFYGRDICQIEVEGMNVSTELIRSGAAWLYKEYDNYFTGLANVEADAKKYKEGLWALPNPVYPPTAKHNGSLDVR